MCELEAPGVGPNAFWGLRMLSKHDATRGTDILSGTIHGGRGITIVAYVAGRLAARLFKHHVPPDACRESLICGVAELRIIPTLSGFILKGPHHLPDVLSKRHDRENGGAE